MQKATKQLIGAVVIVIVLIVVAFAAISFANRDNDSKNFDNTNDVPEQSDPNKTDSRDTTKEADDGTITRDQAEKIATDRYGGTIQETENDDYKNKDVWEVEIRDSKDGRIEVKVDKKTGEILNEEKD